MGLLLSRTGSDRREDHDLADIHFVGVGDACPVRSRSEDWWGGTKASGSHDVGKAKAAHVDALEGHSRKGHRDALVAAVALEANDEVVQVAGVPEHSRVASEGVAHLDLVGVAAVDVDKGHGRVGREVEEVLSALIAVGGTSGAATAPSRTSVM